MQSLTLSVLSGTYAVSRLEKGSPVPGWALMGDIFSVTRTRDELSVVCPQGFVPAGVLSEGSWKCIKADGPLDLSLTGILASLAVPLEKAGVPVFAISTYDTDYLLVKEAYLEKAVMALRGAGHNFI